MASIDERVVAMSFENAKFEAGVAQTMATLTKLNATINKLGSTTGFQDIEAAANKVHFTAPLSAIEKLKSKLGFGEAKASFQELEGASHRVTFSGITSAIDKVKSKLSFPEAKTAFAELSAADDKVQFADAAGEVDKLSARFGAMQTAAVTAFATIVSRGTTAALQLTNRLNPIRSALDGFADYELKIGATQTIMAGTGESIGQVSKYLKDLDIYADRTIYSLRDMTSNIGKFTNAGVKLPIAVDAMKGISNVAALSGANTEEAARAMYNFGQAIGQGTVRMADWRSIELANMGTKEFKEQLIDAALAAGTLKKASDGTVRSLKGNEVNFKTFGITLQDQWLTSEALVKTLNKYADETTALGKKAFAAATDVKTFSMMMETLAAAAGTGWTDTFELVLGNLPEATKLWTNLTNAIGGFIGKGAEARNEALKLWKELGGRDELLKGFKAAFEAIGSVLKPIGQAFRDIFPRKTGEQLLEMTKNFRKFWEELRLGPANMENLRRTFAGFFAVLHIGWTIVKRAIGAIFSLLQAFGKTSGGGILALTGSLGDFFVALDKAISKGKGLDGIFQALGENLKAPLHLIRAITDAVKSLFTNDDGGALAGSLNELAQSASPLGRIIRGVSRAWEDFRNTLEDIYEFLEPFLVKVQEVFSSVGNAIMEGLRSVSYDDIMTFIQTTFLGGLAVGVKKLLGGIGIDLTGGMVDNLKEVLGTLKTTLVSIQKNVVARTMLLIAAAVLALAAAAVIFANIDAKKLSQAMVAISLGIGQLTGAMALLTRLGAGAGLLALPVIASGMVILSVALIGLAGAVHLFAKLDWEEMGKGLLGVAGGLAAMGAATKLMGPGIILIGPGLLLIAVAMTQLAIAMKIFGSMSWEDIGKGLIGIAGAIVTIGVATRTMGPGLAIAAVLLIPLALGLILLSGAVNSFAAIGLADTAKGLIGLAASLVVIGAAINAIPPTIALQAAGLILLGIALTGISVAVAAMGTLGWGTIIKGLLGLGAAMVVFAAGLTLMSGTLPGSLALLAAAGAFAILTPSLIVLGTLKWGTIFKGLAAIAATLGVLAGVGALAAGPLTALGVALLVIGGSVVLVATGIYILAKAFALLGDEGTKGVSVMVAAITALIALIPKMVIDFVKGVADILEQVVLMAPKIAESLVKIIGIWLGAMEKLLPKVAELIGKVIAMILRLVEENAGPIIDAGLKLLVHFLSGVANNIGKVTESVALIIIRFLGELTKKAPRLAESGSKFLAAWLKGIANNLGRVVRQAGNVVVRFLLV